MTMPWLASRSTMPSFHSRHRNRTGSPLGRSATVSKSATNCRSNSTSFAFSAGFVEASVVWTRGFGCVPGAVQMSKATAAAAAVTGASQRNQSRLKFQCVARLIRA